MDLLPASPNIVEPVKDTNILGKPTLQLPELEFSDESSLEYQTNRLLGQDSLLNQQARTQAQENGVASGGIHSSQQEGAAIRAMTDSVLPMAEAEATRAGTQDVNNWTNMTTQNLETYEKEYAERLVDIGYEHEKAIAMAQANTSIAVASMNSITTLLNNTDLEFGDEVKNKILDLANAAQDNNNLILDMGFIY
jgi:hypothetical protein